jgi:hypothetical protein
MTIESLLQLPPALVTLLRFHQVAFYGVAVRNTGTAIIRAGNLIYDNDLLERQYQSVSLEQSFLYPVVHEASCT